jgi:SSS family solute:Na+ symporter
LKEGQKGMLLAALIKFIIPVIVVIPGILAWHIFGTDLDNPDQAYPALVKKVLPGAFIGFFAAVLFGAILSSFNSLLNSSATLFGFDLYKLYFKGDATEQQTVSAGKRFGLIAALISMIISPFVIYAPDGLFSYIQQSLGSLSVPIFAVVIVGVFTKRVPALGAKIVLTAGVGLYLISLIFLEPYFRNSAVEEAIANGITNQSELSIIGAEAYPHYLHVMGILFVVNILIMFIIGKLKPSKEIYKPDVSDLVDATPWKYSIICGIVISLLVLGTYVIF